MKFLHVREELSKARFVVAAAVAALLIASLGMLSGCSSDDSSSEDSDKITVVASFYTMADFVEKIGGDYVEVINLVPAGTEPHDWEPATTDIITLESADLFVYSGVDMESWVDDTLDSLSSDSLVVLMASEGVNLIELESSHSHDDEDEATHDDEDEDSHDHEDSESYDPHVWLSPQNAKIQMSNIKDALVEIDPDNAEYYEANYEIYAAECDALDAEYAEALADVTSHYIVVSHEAFGYICEEYGLEQLAISGIEADTEPDAQTMAEIADFVTENNVSVIFTEELVSTKVAEAIASETGAEIDTLNPLEGLTEDELTSGEDYFSVMRSNLEALVRALS